ncbi:MAG: hypothetical protein HOV79_32755 [Hamadaea sp.]|nr:hypothetical protein [Hamadaea sp.]
MLTNSPYSAGPAVHALHRLGQWDDALRQLGDDSPELRAQLLVDRFFWQQRGGDEAQAAIDALDGGAVLTRYLAGWLAYARLLFKLDPRADDQATVEAGYTAALTDPALAGWATFKLGVYADNILEDPATGRARFEQARAYCADDPFLESYVVRHLGGHHFDAGEREEGLLLFRQSLYLRATLGYRPQIAAAQATLAGELPDGRERDMLRDAARLTGTELGIPWLAAL